MLFHPLRPHAHQRPDGGGGSVELRDLMLCANLPEPAGVGEGRHALEHHRRGPIRQRPVDDIAVPRDPADIGRTPEHIAVVVIKGHQMRHRRIDQIPARGVDHALRLAGGPRGVQDEQRVFRADFGIGAIGGRFRHFCRQVKVAALNPAGLIAGMLDDQTFHVIVAMQQGGVGV